MGGQEEEEQVIENPDSLDIQVDLSEDSGINVLRPLNVTDMASHQVLLILNQEIKIAPDIFESLWKNCKLHIAVDGGADRLKSYTEARLGKVSEYVPEYIIGDFDSVKEETLESYKRLKVKVIHQETQYSTDLMKALSLCNLVLYYGYKDSGVDEYDGVWQLEQELRKQKNYQSLRKTKLFVLGGIGGRLDQTIHSISTLYKLHRSDPQLELYFINKDFEDVIFAVPMGNNFVAVDTVPEQQKRIIGILPFGPEVTLSTKGLKWDVSNWKSEISTKVSSSNHVVSKSGFHIKCDRDIVINMVLFDEDFSQK